MCFDLLWFTVGFVIAKLFFRKNKGPKKVLIKSREVNTKQPLKVSNITRELKNCKCPNCHKLNTENYTGIGAIPKGDTEEYYDYFVCIECQTEWKISRNK